MLAVDNMHQNLPALEKDKYWVEKCFNLPYTSAEKPVFMGSTYDMRCSTTAQYFNACEMFDETVFLTLSLGVFLDLLGKSLPTPIWADTCQSLYGLHLTSRGARKE